MTRYSLVPILLLSTTSLLGFGAIAQAQITANPGDTNTIVTPNSVKTRFTITGGAQAGGNLFHSFQEFGLKDSQIADFSTNSSIQNIFSRVNGGNPSVIAGILQVSGSNANLYLMNPSGIVFEGNAQLNVPGSFIATTANGIGFGNNWFNAAGINDYGVLLGNPTNLGFTTSQPGAIANAGNLTVRSGQTLALIGGSVINSGGEVSVTGIPYVRNGGELRAWDGQVVVTAVPGERFVRISQPGQLLSFEIQSPSGTSPQNWALPIATLPQLLTGSDVVAPPGNSVQIAGGGTQVILVPGGFQVQPGDVVLNSIQAQTANISANRNLSVVSRDTQGLVISGNANLTAQNRVQLQDGAANPFTLTVGGNLRIQGNSGVDINLLTNERSRFQTGGDLTLVSNGTITGNSRFITGGNFAALNVAGGPGTLTLPTVGTSQGIISAAGDVNVGNYDGASLKVEAGGSITGGNITIQERNITIQGADPDSLILSNQSSLILRAGVTSLRNPLSPANITVGSNAIATTSTPASTGPATITVGSITISPPGGGPGVSGFGPVILSAPGNITVNGAIEALSPLIGTTDFAREGSPLIVNSGGRVAIAGNTRAGNTMILSAGDIEARRIRAAYTFDTAQGRDLGVLRSQTGSITVDSVQVPFGSLSIDAGGVFQARSFYLTSFTNSGPGDIPISLQAQQNLSVRQRGTGFQTGLAVEKDTNGNPIYRRPDTNEVVFFQGYDAVSNQVVFVDANGNPVTGFGSRPTIRTIAFNPATVPADLSYTAGLIVLKGGDNENLYGIFRDSRLSNSSNISVTTLPRPTTPIVTDPNRPNPGDPTNPGGGTNGLTTSDAQTAQRQLTNRDRLGACTPNTTIALKPDRPTRSGPATNQSDPCEPITTDDRLLQIQSDR